MARLCMSLLLGLALAACATPPGPAQISASARVTDDWRLVATADDRRRLRKWRDAWVEALAAARAAGHGAEIAREGALLEPDAALPGALPPPGDYRCRTFKLGARSQGLLDYIVYPWFRCRIGVEQGRPSLVKLTGSQRPIGLLYEDGTRRAVFIGTLQLGDERLALQYSRDRERDMIGALERVGEARWRLAFPYPHFESLLDVIELVPE